jgi:hypothetical protein
VREGALSALLQAAAAQPYSEAVQERACVALTNLTHGAPRASIPPPRYALRG